MLGFLLQNFATIVVGAIVLAIILLAFIHMRKTAKKGGCNCGCAGCAMSDSCGTQAE